LRALVTGATGCVGANVAAALLARGYRVRAMRRESSSLAALDGLEVELVVGNLLDPASLALAMAGCDWVFHVAAVSDYWRTPAEIIYRVNVEGTKNVIRAAQESNVQRLIYTSSIGALGVPRDSQLLDEKATFNLPAERFPYGHSKHLAEGTVREAAEQGLAAVIVNPAAVMGPRDANWIGGSVLQAVQRGQGWFAPPGGLCWAAATDVGIGHVLVAERGRPGERYILGGENLSHRRMQEIVAQVVGERPPLATLPPFLMKWLASAVDGATQRWGLALPFSGEQARLSTVALYCDSSKAVQQLGYPQTAFRLAVEQAYAWYRARGLL